MKRLVILLCFFSYVSLVSAQLAPIKFGDFESWTSRDVKESAIIGGAMKTIYVLGPQEHITTDKLAPYPYGKKTFWSSSNAYARVAGIVKASCSCEPEERGNGKCVRLDTKIEKVKVLGLINVSVLVSGSLFTGETIEPIKSADDPYSNINFGIPFTKKPKALVLDYKCKISSNNYVMKYSGVSSKKIDGVQDRAEILVYLQKRWEDAEGNIHALRIGTMRTQLTHDELEWKNAQRMEIHYGDISKDPYYKDYMQLNSRYRAKNSKGKVVPVQEEGWGSESDTPTHVFVMVTAGNHGAFIGTVGNTLWVDNICFEY